MKNIQELTGWSRTKNVTGGVEVQLPREYTKIVGNLSYQGPVVFIADEYLNRANNMTNKEERKQWLFHCSDFRRQWL